MQLTGGFESWFVMATCPIAVLVALQAGVVVAVVVELAQEN